jgi:hypothetical protein
MALRDKLHATKMARDEGVTSYLTRLTQVRDEIAAVGDIIPEEELVCIALNGFGKQWDVFVKCVVGREKMPTWERLWDDFTQEEIREGSQRGEYKKKMKTTLPWQQRDKGKSKKNSVEGTSSRQGNKKKFDTNKVKCFAWHQLGNFSSQCPNRKKGKPKKQMVATTDMDAFAARFEDEFSLLACLSTSMVTGTWYIDSGASCHMTGVHEYFNNLKEYNANFNIVLGDNSKYRPAGKGIVRFQRESGKPLSINDVLFVPGLTKNLIYVSALEDKGYEVTFRDGRVLIHPRGSNASMGKVLGVRKDKLYKLHFEPACTLVSSNNSGRDLGELWHRQMAHLRHGALKVLREAMTGLPEFSYDQQCVQGVCFGKVCQDNLS